MPRPWVEVPFLESIGDCVVFDNRMVHWGSGRVDAGPGTPLCPAPSTRLIQFGWECGALWDRGLQARGAAPGAT